MNRNARLNAKSTIPDKNDFKNIELSSQARNKSNNDSKIPFQGLALNEDQTINNRLKEQNEYNTNKNVQNIQIKKVNLRVSDSGFKSNKSDKENKLHRFFINDNDKNKIYNHKTNTVNTTK